MKRIKIYIGIICILMFSLLIGCEKFTEINTNPNTTSIPNVKLLCTKVIFDCAKFGGRDASDMIAGNALPKYITKAQTKLSPQYNLIESASFDDFYILPNISSMLDAAKKTDVEAENFYKGIAKFIRAYKFYELTMSMGDIPYTEAGKGAEGIKEPIYDTQENIFIGILNELKEANQFFASAKAPSSGSSYGDPTPLQDDPIKWRGISNALALKILMSLNKKVDVASLDVKNRFSSIVADNNLIKEVEGDSKTEAPANYFGLIYTTEHRHMMYSPISGHTSIAVSSTVIDNLKKLNDRRLFYFAEPAGAALVEDTTLTESDTAAYVGVDFSINYTTMRSNSLQNKFSVLNKRYAELEASEPRMLITYAEQQLILAEAVIRGWISGSAKDYYESGVKSALDLFKDNTASEPYAHGMTIDQDYIDNYFTGEAEFKSSGTSEEQLKQIWIQRYFLNFLQDTRTAFFEYRRTGYPEFPINPETSLNNDGYKDKVPVRWRYPGDELSYNQENYVEALIRQFESEYDEINQVMWVLTD